MRRVSGIAALAAAALASLSGSSAAAGSSPSLRFTSPPSGLAIQGRSLWVSLADDGVILRLDVRSGRRLGRIDVHRQDLRALGGGTLATAGKDIWVAAPVHVGGDPTVGDASGWIGRIDVRRSTLRITQIYGDQPAQVAVGTAGVWVSGGHTVWRIDPRTRRVIATVHLPRNVGAIAVGARAVWVDEQNAGVLVRIDPRARKVLGSTAIGPSMSGSSLALGRFLWATTDRGVVALDPASGSIVRRITLPKPSAVAVDGAHVWALAPDGLYSIAGTKASRRVALGPGVAGLLVAARGIVWLSDGATNTLRRAV